MEFQAIKAGDLLFPGKTQWPECNLLQYTKSGPMRIIAYESSAPQKNESARKGKLSWHCMFLNQLFGFCIIFTVWEIGQMLLSLSGCMITEECNLIDQSQSLKANVNYKRKSPKVLLGRNCV